MVSGACANSTCALSRARAVLAVVIIFAAGISSALAQDIEPRAYSNAPVGVNFLVAAYAHSEGGLATDPAFPLTNEDLRIDTMVLGYARVLDVWGKSGKFDVILPYSWLSGSAEFEGMPREREVSGFGDPRLRFSVNFYGAPALSLKEFASYEQDLIVGASLQVTVPAGQYDPNKLVNIGTNRWSFKPEVGLSKAWKPWTLELAAGAAFYTDNDDFLGGKTREQDPIYSVQGGVIYNFPSGVWVGLNGTYYTGGRTTIDGVRGNDLQRNSRLGVTLALPVDRLNSIKFFASDGVSTRFGDDFTVFGVAWQYRWGGGL
jgi:hypothetical protein